MDSGLFDLSQGGGVVRQTLCFVGRVVLGIIVISLLAIAINDADQIPFKYQVMATIVLVVAALLWIRRSDRRRRNFYEPFNH